MWKTHRSQATDPAWKHAIGACLWAAIKLVRKVFGAEPWR